MSVRQPCKVTYCTHYPDQMLTGFYMVKATTTLIFFFYFWTITASNMNALLKR